jgi:fermentation-respiration switch protein FrsA (DUF1100 family)
VKEQVAGNHARALAERDFVTLAFDHRYFGESGGEPRQFESPPRKVEDLTSAVDYLSGLPEVDAERLFAVGVCAGAGYLSGLVADEPRVKAWATVAGFFHSAEMQKQWMGDGYDAAIARAQAARDKYDATGELETIPAVGDGDVAMPLAEAFEYYGTDRGACANYENAFAVLSRLDTLTWDAQSKAPRIQQPTLLIHSENALAPNLARQFFEALAGPKEDLWMESKGQIDFYDDPALIDPAADRIAKHFRSVG